jgi:hypothetical protein
LALHCRRKTCGTVETTELLHSLLVTFSGHQGCDTLGVPLLDSDQTWETWNSQKMYPRSRQCATLCPDWNTDQGRHSSTNTYRCARGSTSLESYQVGLVRSVAVEKPMLKPP